MILKCLECGHIFDDYEIEKWTEPHGEPMDGCPTCGGAYEETKRCKKCHGEFLEEELMDGFCEECIYDTVDYDLFLEYLERHSELEDFFSAFYADKEDELNKELKQWFARRVLDDQLTKSDGFMLSITKYVQADFFGWTNFLNAKAGGDI